MQIPKPSDAIHRAYMLRILTSIADDPFLVQSLRFKGGTYAALVGLLNRFSVDLDFDLIEPAKNKEVQKHLEKIFKDLNLSIHDKSANVPQYFVKYPNSTGERNTIQVDVTFPAPQTNDYEAVFIRDIDRILYGHTPSTLFSNKLVALMDRYDRRKTIAGRDLYDIHIFFMAKLNYKAEIIEERTNLSAPVFLKKLKTFIEKHVTQTLIDQDLNTLLPPEEFKKIRKFIKPEVLQFLGEKN